MTPTGAGWGRGWLLLVVLEALGRGATTVGAEGTAVAGDFT
jgi:hypothetical protein